MLEVLIGLCIMFLLCLGWIGFYLLDEFGFEKPPKIIKIIGIVEIILIVIVVVSSVAYSIGSFFLN